MRLNIDCIRDILMCVEEHSGYNKVATFIDAEFAKKHTGDHVIGGTKMKDYNQKLLEKYSNDELMYHINYCFNDGLIEAGNTPVPARIAIADLSPKGHKFIENIRTDNIFNGVKNVAEKIGSSSLDAITQIATNTVTQLIKSQFNLP